MPKKRKFSPSTIQHNAEETSQLNIRQQQQADNNYAESQRHKRNGNKTNYLNCLLRAAELKHSQACYEIGTLKLEQLQIGQYFCLELNCHTHNTLAALAPITDYQNQVPYEYYRMFLNHALTLYNFIDNISQKTELHKDHERKIKSLAPASHYFQKALAIGTEKPLQAHINMLLGLLYAEGVEHQPDLKSATDSFATYLKLNTEDTIELTLFMYSDNIITALVAAFKQIRKNFIQKIILKGTGEISVYASQLLMDLIYYNSRIINLELSGLIMKADDSQLIKNYLQRNMHVMAQHTFAEKANVIRNGFNNTDKLPTIVPSLFRLSLFAVDKNTYLKEILPVELQKALAERDKCGHVTICMDSDDINQATNKAARFI